jgi:hypothetical protein
MYHSLGSEKLVGKKIRIKYLFYKYDRLSQNELNFMLMVEVLLIIFKTLSRFVLL